MNTESFSKWRRASAMGIAFLVTFLAAAFVAASPAMAGKKATLAADINPGPTDPDPTTPPRSDPPLTSPTDSKNPVRQPGNVLNRAPVG